MKKIVLKILFLAFIAIGCQQKKQSKKNIAEINVPMKSDFDLKSHYADFKTKMTELDTLNIWVDHSVCTFQGYEQIIITKKSDSIIILSEFKDYDEQNPILNGKRFLKKGYRKMIQFGILILFWKEIKVE